MRLAIGLPLTTDREYSQFWDSFSVMRKPDHIYLRPNYPGRIDLVRNELVRRAKEMDASHLMMMDTDQVYPPDTIEQLLETMQLTGSKVVGTVIYRRYPPFDPLVFMHDGNGYCKPKDKEIYANKYLKVHTTGCGCILYDMEVFRAIDKPWFEDKSAEVQDETGKEGPGEDFDFCRKLERHGYDIWVNTELDIAHLALLSVDRSYHKIYMKVKEVFGRER